MMMMVFVFTQPFWIWFLSLTVAAFLLPRLLPRSAKAIGVVFPWLVLVGFLVATMVNVNSFIDVAVTDTMGAYMGFGIDQGLINPVHLLVRTSWVGWLYPQSAWDSIPSGPMGVEYIPFELWKTMVLDFILGSAFWFGTSRLIVRRHGRTA